MMKFYVTTERSPDAADPEDRVWTVSREPDAEGWTTDSGCEGYGLTKVEAQFLADAANEKIAREGEPSLPPTVHALIRNGARR